ncbi:restriction endonuclease subunit S [Methylicorpusculum oleiharenae]|uniref:restriction endonuclease subunit S n=1 Tax=Methylicorpusculum oleiharenae TaxID=1338687 RepID=UPI001356ED94|nr:restriction endonuclease subunit S [Methylicorpusculum oleiharenae]MCD2451882.1 restriction endonuclease subunit S [Methylicorpusculum oleiharenae]
MSRWPMVSLGELLRRSNETAILDFNTEYHEVTIRLWGKGVFSRGRVRGGDVGTSRQLVRANQLILSKIDARNGAIGIVPPELDGAIVSNDFPSFEFAEKLDSSFMGWLVRSTPFVELCKAASEGTTNRVRIKEDRFLTQQIQLPSLEKQQIIVARLNQLADKVRQVKEHLDAAENDAFRLLISMATRRDLSDEQRKSMGWKETAIGDFAKLALSPVTVDANENYPNIGIYSFAKGLFEKPPIEGSRTSAKTLYKIRNGQFIYSRLFAFEGGYALVPPEFDGYYVSNEFPTFDIDLEKATSKFLITLFLTEQDWQELARSSKGVGDRRLRIQPEKILHRKIWLPPLREQERIEKMFDAYQALKNKHTGIREANQALIPATLERLFSSEGHQHG